MAVVSTSSGWKPMPETASPTVTITLEIPRSLIQQLRDQLWPPDPTLADDLRAIREKYLARTPAAPKPPVAA
jgi:hypothetical protein